MSLGRSAEAPQGGLPGLNGGYSGWRSQPDKPDQPPFANPKSPDPNPAKHALAQTARALRSVTQAALDDLVTTVFPGVCRVCDLPLVRAQATPVCDACLAHVKPQPGSLCQVCGEAMGMESERFAESFGTEARLCTPCRRLPPAFARAVAYAVYEGNLRELVHLLKYERVTGLARPLGSMLAQAVSLLTEEIALAPHPVLVVAVPLFHTRQRGRGFNHAALLADAALRDLRLHRPDLRLQEAHSLLRRVRETSSQFGLSPHARRANLRGAFEAPDPSAIAGRDVLVIDDIYTTGATARACAHVLRQAGARSVLVATLARAQVESVAMWDAAGAGDRQQTSSETQQPIGNRRT